MIGGSPLSLADSGKRRPISTSFIERDFSSFIFMTTVTQSSSPAAVHHDSLPTVRWSFQQREVQLFAAALLALDALMLIACFISMNWMRGPFEIAQPPLYFFVIPLIASGLCLYLIDGYKSGNDMVSLGYASQHLVAVAAAVVIVLFASFVLFPDLGAVKPRRGNIALAFLLFLPLSLLYRRILCLRTRHRAAGRSILFLGSPGDAERFLRDYCRPHGVENILFATGSSPGAPGAQTVGSFMHQQLDLALFRRYEGKVGAVIFAEDSAGYEPQLLHALINLRFASVPIYTLETFYQARLRKIPVSAINHAWLLKQGFRIAHDPVYLHLKRMSDVFVSGFALLAASPLFLLVSLAVKLTDRGPVFFKQQRVGQDKRPFTVYKFRTMQVGAEQGDLYTQKKDSRITPLGRYLRKWRVDEFPQLWNVFLGDMSMIGPRAEWDKLVGQYEREIPCYHFRHLVKPGITGWAQISYPYGANLEDTVHKLEYDLYYIRHFSFQLDASIVLKTIHTMIAAKGQ